MVANRLFVSERCEGINVLKRVVYYFIANLVHSSPLQEVGRPQTHERRARPIVWSVCVGSSFWLRQHVAVLEKFADVHIAWALQ